MQSRRWHLAVIAGLLASGSALAQGTNRICLADLNNDGVVDERDIQIFADLQAAGQPRADFNGDGRFDVADTQLFLKAFDLGCDTAILGFGPAAASPGEIVRVQIANLPGDCEPDDLCAIGGGGAAFRAVNILPGPQDGIKIVELEVLPFPGDAGPGPILIAIGQGAADPLPLPLPGAGVPDPVWVWQGIPGAEPLVAPGDFEPVPVPPAFDKKFQGTFFFADGALCLDLPAIDWNRCDDIFIQFRAWCAVRAPDVIIPRIVICKDDPTTKDVARAICDAITGAFQARGITELFCRVIDLGNGRCRICLEYTDCEINAPAWQFQGPQPFALACVTGPAADCDKVCANFSGPCVTDVQPPVGNPGDIVCIFLDPGSLPPGTEAKDLCILHSGGVVFEGRDIQIDPATGQIKVFAEVTNVPAGVDGLPGRIMIRVGDGECVDLPPPFPGTCQVEPGFRWVPLDGFPMIGGGNFTPGAGDPANKRFVQKWTLENGRQCLIIPGNLTLERCDSIEILLRLWCPVRSPDINIPRILVCERIGAGEFADLICRAIVDAFTNGQQVPPINEVDCQVIPLPDGSFKVSLGYTDCAITGGVAENGLPWTQVAVCKDDPACEDKCTVDPNKPRIVGFNGVPQPGQFVQMQLINLPPGVQNADQFCLAADGGQLFQPEFLEVFGNGQALLGARVLPQGAGVVPGELMFRLGRGQRFMPQIVDDRIGVVLQDPAWVWEPFNIDDPACPGPGWVPGGGVACEGEQSRCWELLADGRLCFEIMGGLQPGCKISIFLRAYCPTRNPDVHIENICVTRPLSPFEVAMAICDVITAAYTQAGIPEIRCSVEPGPNGFPSVKLGYADCRVDGPNWGPGGKNPSTVTICCPNTGGGPEVKDVDNPFALPGQVVCMTVCDVPAGKGPEDWCLAANGGQLFQVLDQQDLGNGMAKLFAQVLPAGQNVIPGNIMIACGNGQIVPIAVPQGLALGGGFPWVWQGDPNMQPGGGPMWNGNGAGEPGIFCQGGAPTLNWTFSPTGGQLCLQLPSTPLAPGASVSIFLRAYCPVRSPDVTIPEITNVSGSPIGAFALANQLCFIITQAYTNAGIPQITCTVTNTPMGPKITLGYSDCAVTGPTWGAGGTNPSTFQVCP